MSFTSVRTNATTAGAVTAIGASHLAVDLVGGGFGALLPTIAERMSLSSTSVGVLVALFSVSALGLQPFKGGLADRFGARHVSAIAAAIAASFLAATAVVTSLTVLVIAIVVGGLASAAFHPAGAVLARRHGRDAPEHAVALFAAAGTVGLALGPIAAISLAGERRGAGILLLAVPALLIAPATWWRSRRTPTTSSSLQDVRPGERTLLRVEIARLAGAATMVAIVTTTIASTLPRWIADQPNRSAGDATIGWALAAFSLAAAAGGVAGGRLSSRVAPERLLRVSLLAAVVPAAGLAMAPPASVMSFAALVATGLLVGPALPLLLVAAQSEAPERAATASGIIMGLSHGLAGLAYIGVSIVIGVAGYGAGVIMGAAALLPAAILVGAPREVLDATTRQEGRRLVAVCACVVDRSPVVAPTAVA